MKKTCRKYWNDEIAKDIVQVKSVRFDNPQFTLETTFDRVDFTKLLTEKFKLKPETVEAFFNEVRAFDYYDQSGMTTAELFEKHFPGRNDVVRLLMEPITYANGSTLDEPAQTYGIVFGNFMSQGVYTFLGGTDVMLDMMVRRLRDQGVDCETRCAVERVLTDAGKVRAAVVNGREVRTRAVVSNGNLRRTVLEMVGPDSLPAAFVEGVRAVRLSNSSCQVYLGIKPGERLDPIGDLLFTSTCPEFDADAVCSRTVSSRTYSVYYPSIRPDGPERYTIVASMNARHEDWDTLDDDQYRRAKQALIEDTLDHLERYVPRVRSRIDHQEAATPRTFLRYTGHVGGASFGTKFEGLRHSMALPQQLAGMYHTGSVGIIMSGWLGAANYGVITANEVEKYLTGTAAPAAVP
jgi:phytoene dehydrogenase-like protein